MPMSKAKSAASGGRQRSLRDRYLAVDTANVADVLDNMGLRDQGLSSGFRAITGKRLAGPAYTIKGKMGAYEGTGDPEKMEACQGIGAGELAVWAGDGTGVCYFGELIALGMMERGCVGALVDGGIRDSRVLLEHGFPTFARYTSSVQSIGRWKVSEWQVPVSLPGATANTVLIHPGDFIVADEDGAIVVPAAAVLPVLVSAEETTERESAVRSELREGLPLSEALAKFGHV